MQLTSSRQAWQPLLSAPFAERCFRLFDSIPSRLAPPASPSLSAGLAGTGLFLAYLAKTSRCDVTLARAVTLVQQAADAIATEDLTWDLFSGFTGIAWTVQHLLRHFSESDEADLNEEIDDAVLALVGQRPWPAPYDLVGGVTGLGVYALERLPGETARRCLGEIVARLSELAEPIGKGLSWLTSPDWLPPEARERFPKGEYNLGMAHGVPGVISLLSSIHAAGIERDRTALLLRGAVRWLLDRALADDRVSRFPHHWLPDMPPAPSRLGWCYGDLAIAAALRLAGIALADAAWESLAIEFAQRAARRTLADSRVTDAGLCHGAAGVAHLFNRFYQATGIEIFADASRLWFERALDMLDGHGQPVDGSFLVGGAGIGLALLAAVTPVAPAWDSVLLLSIPSHLHES